MTAPIDDVASDSLSDKEAARVYERFPDLRKQCPTCKGRGSYCWEGKEYECDCARQISLAKHYTAAGIGRDFQRMDWSDWQGSEAAFRQIHDYLLRYEAYLDRGVGLVLWGEVGTGKTFLANMIAKELVRRRVTTYASTASNMVEAFTASWGGSEEAGIQKAWFARKFMYSDALVIDDIGKEFKSNNRLSPTTFDMILRTRDQDSRATFIATNLAGQQLSFGYGASVLSMVQGRNILVEVVGVDYRLSSGHIRRREIDQGETRPIV